MERKRSSDIDIVTLGIAGAASAIAAYVTSKVWAGGTLITAAVTPVLVALVREALARPVDRIATLRERRTMEQPRVTLDEAPPPPPSPGGDLGPVKVYGAGLRRRWRLAVVTGLAAFAIVVAVFTIPELIAGKSIGGGAGDRTTFFGGKRDDAPRDGDRERPSGEDDAAPTAEPEADERAPDEPDEEATPALTPTPTPTPTSTPTAAPTASGTPTP